MASQIKKKDFKVMSTFMCEEIGCSRRIKLNLVLRKPKQAHFKCFKHFKADEYIRRNPDAR